MPSSTAKPTSKKAASKSLASSAKVTAATTTAAPKTPLKSALKKTTTPSIPKRAVPKAVHYDSDSDSDHKSAKSSKRPRHSQNSSGSIVPDYVERQRQTQATRIQSTQHAFTGPGGVTLTPIGIDPRQPKGLLPKPSSSPDENDNHDEITTRLQSSRSNKLQLTEHATEDDIAGDDDFPAPDDDYYDTGADSVPIVAKERLSDSLDHEYRPEEAEQSDHESEEEITFESVFSSKKAESKSDLVLGSRNHVQRHNDEGSIADLFGAPQVRSVMPSQPPTLFQAPVIPAAPQMFSPFQQQPSQLWQQTPWGFQPVPQPGYMQPPVPFFFPQGPLMQPAPYMATPTGAWGTSPAASNPPPPRFEELEDGPL